MRPLKLLPKYLLLTVTLSLVAVAAIAIILNTVYRNSLIELVDTSVLSNEAAFAERAGAHAVQTSERLAADLAESIAAQDDEAIANLLQRASAITGAKLILITDTEGRRLGYSGDLELGQKFKSEGRTGSIISNENLLVEIPIVYEGISVGSMLKIFGVPPNTLKSDLDEIRSAYEREIFYSGLATIIVTILIITIVIGVVAFKQVKAINALVESAEQLAESDFGSDLTIGRSDELGQLATAFNKMRDKLRVTTISRDHLDRLLSGMSDAIILTDPEGKITRINKATSRLLDFREDEMLGLPIDTFLTPPEREGFALTEDQSKPQETAFLSKAGQKIAVSYTRAKIDGDEPEFTEFIVALRNISERKATEQRIRYLARTDALTKVANRMQFQHLLQRTIARSLRARKKFAFLYLDIDHFKDINDTFGHGAGDTCLETLTDRLKRLLPDGVVLGRLAGDEFGIVLQDGGAADGLQAYIESTCKIILSDIARLVDAQGHEIYMTASIGIARFPEDADNVIDLIRNADSALYRAKRAGGNTFDSYDPQMYAEAVERLMLKSKLRRSYELDELLMHYQPKIDLKTGVVVGAEALVRWDLSERGLILPSEFIPLAEETNLIVEIGEWVLNRVCTDYRLWQQEIEDPGQISVNLSLKQLKQPNFSGRFNRIFSRHNVPPSSLELEITETTLMQDADRTVKILDELHRMGLSLAIDDFGTGYSSLSALQQFPINTLKIDKSFVRKAAENADDATIIKTIIDMAHRLNIEVVAEGVELEEQLSYLRTINCDYVQGMLFGQPMAADDYRDLLLIERNGTQSYRALFA